MLPGWCAAVKFVVTLCDLSLADRASSYNWALLWRAAKSGSHRSRVSRFSFFFRDARVRIRQQWHGTENRADDSTTPERKPIASIANFMSLGVRNGEFTLSPPHRLRTRIASEYYTPIVSNCIRKSDFQKCYYPFTKLIFLLHNLKN